MSYFTKPSKEFHINGYRLQYWLYAILNKEFGSEVKIHRDSLCSLYEANRHSFEINTNTLPIEMVEKFFVKKLNECEFLDDKRGIGQYSLEKKTQRTTGLEKLHVSISKQKTGLDHRNTSRPSLIVNVQVSWNKIGIKK